MSEPEDMKRRLVQRNRVPESTECQSWGAGSTPSDLEGPSSQLGRVSSVWKLGHQTELQTRRPHFHDTLQHMMAPEQAAAPPPLPLHLHLRPHPRRHLVLTHPFMHHIFMKLLLPVRNRARHQHQHPG